MTRRRTRDTAETAREPAGELDPNTLDDAALARHALRAVAADAQAPAAARAQAARTLAEMAGKLGAGRDTPQDTAPVFSLSRRDLEREIARLKASAQVRPSETPDGV